MPGDGYVVGRDNTGAVAEPRRLLHRSVRDGDRTVHAMSSKALLDRWKSPEGRLLAEEVGQCLTGHVWGFRRASGLTRAGGTSLWASAGTAPGSPALP